MNPVDLIDYAEHSEKIHSNFLKAGQVKLKVIQRKRVLLAHCLDSVLIFMLSSWAGTLLNLSLSNLLVTRSLRQAFSKIETMPLSLSLIVLTAFSYYFFSYFFNQGQTISMRLLGIRVRMEEMAYRASMVSGLYSLSVSLSLGLSLLIESERLQGTGLGTFETHDYLYQELLLEKLIQPFSLVEFAERNVVKTKTEFEEFKQAA